jgi:DNA repair exonuclease SbcCD ATPase subunit
LTNKNPAIAQDLYFKQQNNITDLRQQLEQRDQRIACLEDKNTELLKKQDYYQEVQQQYRDLQQKLSRNPQLYIQLVQPPDRANDRRIQMENQKKAYERQARIDAERAAEHERAYKEILVENPH